MKEREMKDREMKDREMTKRWVQRDGQEIRGDDERNKIQSR